MEGDYVGPRRREARLKRLKRWLKRDWRTSWAGNSYINAQGFNVVVFPKGGRWSARVEHRVSGAKRFSGTCVSIEKAKAAALDLVTQMEETEH
jgi:hypothetical protein